MPPALQPALGRAADRRRGVAAGRTCTQLRVLTRVRGAAGKIGCAGIRRSTPLPWHAIACRRPSLVDGPRRAKRRGPMESRCVACSRSFSALVRGARRSRRGPALAPRPGPGLAGLRPAAAADAWSTAARPTRSRSTDPELVWLREQDELALRCSNVEVRTPAGALVASAPLGRAAPWQSRRSCSERRLELVEAQLELPEIELTRDDERQAGADLRRPARRSCRSARRRAAAGSAHCSGDGGEDQRSSSRRAAAGPRHRPVARSSSDAVTGDRATAADAVFDLKRGRSSLAGVARRASSASGSVEATGEPTHDAGPAGRSRSSCSRLQAQGFQAFAPDLPLAGLALPVSGTMHFSIDRRDRASSGRPAMDLTIGRGHDRGHGASAWRPIPIKQGALQRHARADWTGRRPDRAAAARQRRLHAERHRQGWRDRRASSRPTSTVDAEELDVAEVLALVADGASPAAPAPGSRSNVTAGQFGAVTVQIDERRHAARSAGSRRPASPSAAAQVRYLDTMPPGHRPDRHGRRSPATACGSS